MQFHQYHQDFLSLAHYHGLRTAAEYRERVLLPQNPNSLSAVLCGIETRWLRQRGPYYNVWPTIVPLLMRIDLDFPADCVHLPMDTLSIRLPQVNNPLEPITAILAARIEMKAETGILLYVQSEGIRGGEIFSFGHTTDTVEQRLNSHVSPMATELNVDGENRRQLADAEFAAQRLYCRNAAKLVCALCILDNDPRLIRPDVLGKDETAYQNAVRLGDVAAAKVAADRAFRRRGPGWEIGRDYEPQQHGAYVVPPHPQRYWVGPGRKQAIIKVRRGYAVERDELLRMPTGYELDETETTNTGNGR